ncbi:MAG: Kazal-type serine protease inhibitor domain-containing protein, partial [Sandaracinaceae bacterium]|nr:Kazal-type serine protease inhibitor domain-containing protein [Sandaracinaceae bacterium]
MRIAHYQGFGFALIALPMTGLLLSGCSCGGSHTPRPTEAGVDVRSDGSFTNCTSNADCREGEYCAGDGCGTEGMCVARPEGCPTVYAPVCGCDGRTYSNGCVAAASGVRVAHNGECGGGRDAGADTPLKPMQCFAHADCYSGEYCGGPGCALPGVCTSRPDACPPVARPVCGCDGRTYSNECVAAMNGVRVAH